MPKPSLEGVKAKRDRAETHLKTVEQTIASFLDSQPYPVIIESDPHRGRYVVKLQSTKPLPMREFAVVIGDCVHNLRSTLDYIAWELAGANPNDRDTMFPIFDDRVKFGKHGAWRIKNVPSAPRALIEKKQPYNTPDPKMSALWAIERFDTADKHRLLTVTVPVASSLNITPTRRSGSADRIDRAKIQYRTSDLVDNAIIAVVAFAAPTPNVEVKAKFTPQIAFSDRDSAGLAMHVIPNLRVLLAQVDRTIADFAGFF